MEVEETQSTTTQENTPPNADDESSQTQNNPLDEETIQKGILKDEAKLETLQDDFKAMSDGLHKEWRQVLKETPSAYFTEEQLEIITSSSDIDATSELLRTGFENYRDAKLSEKQKEIDTFSGELKKRKGEFDLLTNSNKFAKENPKVDMEVFAEFIQEDLTSRQKAAFRQEAKTKYDFLKLAHEEYLKQNPEEKEDEDLPPDLSGVNGASGAAGGSAESQAERQAYLKSIGFGR